ncbi:MAG: glycosyltransferase [Cyanobacteria bacterium J06629_18]
MNSSKYYFQSSSFKTIICSSYGRNRFDDKRELGIDKSVHFLGHRADIPQLLALSDLLVLPSYTEGLPLVILEAMAAGLPIITTDIGGLCEQVEHGINGLIIPPSDATALAIALRTLKNNPAKIATMAAASRQIAEKRFDAQRNYAAVLKVMKSVSRKSGSLYSAENLHHV